jgi:serine/threonine protein kinase
MALLPQKVGSLTLVRALENDGVCQRYVGILDDAAGTQVIVRKLLPPLRRDPEVYRAVRARIDDLLPIRHPALVPITHAFDHDGDLYIASEWADTVTMADVITRCRTHDEPLPLHLFLHFAVQICNALEALHGGSGASTGVAHVLHHQLRPDALSVTRAGRVALGEYGLLSGPTFATATGGFRLRTAYLAPEQTHGEARQVLDDEDSASGLRRLSPATDLFSLGAVLYELLVHKPMFRASTPLRTLAMVRRAEVTTQLLEVKEVFPGVDRILYRALSLHPRHRYQRAFVLREDLRGLMAEFSFSNIDADCRAFLAPLFQGTAKAADDLLPRRPRPVLDVSETEPTVLARIDVDAIRRGLGGTALEPFPDDLDDPLDYGGGDAAPTGAFDLPSSSGPIERPVHYAADAPDENWTDVLPVEPAAVPSAAIRARLQPDHPAPDTEELAPTEEQDLEPVAVGGTPPVPDPDASGVHDAETRILPVVDERTDPGTPVNLVLGAGVASLVAIAVTLCAGGGLIAAIATQRPAPEPVAPATRRILLPDGRSDAWRAIPTSPPPPALGEPSPAVAPAIDAMHAGDPAQALSRAAVATPSSPADERMLAEVTGNAHRMLFERTEDRAHLAAAIEAWTTYRGLATSAAQRAHADAHLAYLGAL